MYNFEALLDGAGLQSAQEIFPQISQIGADQFSAFYLRSSAKSAGNKNYEFGSYHEPIRPAN
jgi:hypothetical protein